MLNASALSRFTCADCKEEQWFAISSINFGHSWAMAVNALPGTEVLEISRYRRLGHRIIGTRKLLHPSILSSWSEELFRITVVKLEHFITFNCLKLGAHLETSCSKQESETCELAISMSVK